VIIQNKGHKNEKASIFSNHYNNRQLSRQIYTVVKTMTPQRFCQDCAYKHDCKKLYQQLGSVKGPSVAGRVIVAFLLPVIVFIVALAAFEKILAGTVNNKEAQTALSFLPALSATFIFVQRAKLSEVNQRQNG
jgi:hypothetical protein